MIDDIPDGHDRDAWPTPGPNEPDPTDDDDAADTGGKGTVVKEMVTCSNKSCACMDGGPKHGPYRYRCYYENGSPPNT